MSSPLVLALDTATDSATVSLMTGEGGSYRELSGQSLPGARSHTHSLLTMIDACLQEAGAEPKDLTALLVGRGPGTFTGVRIAVATARSLALSLERPVLGVSSLSALVAGALESGQVPLDRELLVPLIDARRGQVFGMVYGKGGAERGYQGLWVRLSDPFVTEPGSLPKEVAARAAGGDRAAAAEPSEKSGGGAMLFLGAVEAVEGAVDSQPLHARNLLLGQEGLAENPTLLEGRGIPAWLHEGGLGGRDWVDAVPGTLGTPEAVVPVYVRSPDADVHITKMRDPWAT